MHSGCGHETGVTVLMSSPYASKVAPQSTLSPAFHLRSVLHQRDYMALLKITSHIDFLGTLADVRGVMLQAATQKRLPIVHFQTMLSTMACLKLSRSLGSNLTTSEPLISSPASLVSAANLDHVIPLTSCTTLKLSIPASKRSI